MTIIILMIILTDFSGVVAGSLTVSITDPNSYLAGASGGVYALIRYDGMRMYDYMRMYDVYEDV